MSSTHITNDAFTKAIGKALHKPILLPAIPAFIIKTLFGDMAGMVLEGSRVSNEKIKKAGFNFEFENIEKVDKFDLVQINFFVIPNV